MKTIKNWIDTIWSVCSLRHISSIFYNDEHEIISERGWEKLNEDETRT